MEKLVIKDNLTQWFCLQEKQKQGQEFGLFLEFLWIDREMLWIIFYRFYIGPIFTYIIHRYKHLDP
jgi:hypothetical protein